MEELTEELQKYGELVGPTKLRFKAKYNYERDFTVEWTIKIRTGNRGMVSRVLSARGHDNETILKELMVAVLKADRDEGIYVPEPEDLKGSFKDIPRGNRWGT